MSRGAMSRHENANTGTDTWLTPRHIIDALGTFDLDPCAAPDPERWPTARTHYTYRDDGLTQDWTVIDWLNIKGERCDCPCHTLSPTTRSALAAASTNRSTPTANAAANPTECHGAETANANTPANGSVNAAQTPTATPNAWPTCSACSTCSPQQPRNARVFLNPPYSQAWQWVHRLAEHGEGTALVFARTETAGFALHVWQRASAILFLHGRLTFHHANGSRAVGNAGAPSCLVAYGIEDALALAASDIPGSLVTTWRYRGGDIDGQPTLWT